MTDLNFQWPPMPYWPGELHDEHVTRAKLRAIGINLEAWDRPFSFDAQPSYDAVLRLIEENQDGHA